MAGKNRILFLSSLIVCISVAVSMGFGKFQQLFPCDENRRCGGQPTCRKLSSCDMNTTNDKEKIKSNTTTVQSVPSHVTSNFQNDSETSNLQSSTTGAVTLPSPSTSDPQPTPKLSTASFFQCSCTDGITCQRPTDCDDVYKSCSQNDDVYSIKPKDWQGPSAFDVFCKMDDSGGWTVIQRRVEGGSVDLWQTWILFKGTIGNVTLGKEFWLGNEKIYHLTNQKTYILRIDFQVENGSTYFAEYSSFRIGDETDKYRVRDLGVYNGNAGGQPLVTLKNGECPFTTHDTSDGSYSAGCPEPWRYGWWYCSGNCIESNLNDQDSGGNNILGGIDKH